MRDYFCDGMLTCEITSCGSDDTDTGRRLTEEEEQKRKEVEELIPISEFNAVQSLTNLLEALLTPANGVDRAADPEAFFPMCEKWFTFCPTWSMGATATEAGVAVT